ncbi:hypothetical protein GCM10027405_04860 [Arthrobacter alkaliphilus]|uniref:hypothetical protein n=1 Tax=Arthrobacter alkaliphilus TaxID=369936 RepID=UPI001F1A4629|nr:hypothetical protein [Arthrobacter alkaliphilus]
MTRAFWRVTGRRIDLAGDQAWLNAPMHRESVIGDTWLTDAAAAIGGRVVRNEPGAGLLPKFASLDGPQFRSADVHPDIRDFYEHTSLWRMEVWTAWNPLFQPGGNLVARYFGRRVQQLAIPTRPLETAHGMDSDVAAILAPDGRQLGAGWIRTLRSTAAYVYSGYYRVTTLPETTQPSVHVSFPLESGNVQVFLRPRALTDGSLELLSTRGPFGTDGAYLAVSRNGIAHAARVPLHETFRLYVDDDGVLRTDHVIRFRSAVAVRLHYKLTRHE